MKFYLARTMVNPSLFHGDGLFLALAKRIPGKQRINSGQSPRMKCSI